MTRRTTAVTIAVLLALLAVGCSDDDTAADPSSTPSASESSPTAGPTSPTSTPPTSPPTTSPSTTAGTTTSEPVSTAPPTATAGPTTPPAAAEDWVSIVQGLENTRGALYEAPDPTRASEMCAVNSLCEEQLQAQFTDMVSNGYRVVESPPLQVVTAELVPNSYEGASVAESIVVSVDVVFRVPEGAAGRIIDAAGTTVYNISYTPPPGQTYTTRMTLLRASASDPWRESLQEEVP